MAIKSQTNNMFTQARFKLTGWYLLIIMTISLSFSAFIYKSVTTEFQRRLANIERRLDLPNRGVPLPPGQERFFIEDFKATRLQILYILIYTNGLILVFSAGAGYFLAGKTLNPIENAMEEQKRFVADASHELKTPLTALITTTEVMLNDKKLNLESAKKALKENLSEAENLKYLTESLLSLAAYQQNEGSFPQNKVNIKDIVNKSIKTLGPQARRKNIKITDNSKKIIFNANVEMMQKLLTIILDNAIKYTLKNGKVSISTKKTKKNIVISIKDNGVGIAKKDLDHIFDRFYRADLSRSKSKSHGFGLGLSIAKDIAQLHNGKINVQSEPQKGSTFSIKLPL